LKKITLIGVFLIIGSFCFGQSNFSRGEELFMRNQPDLAAAYLESALSDEPGRTITYLYLGIVYEQLGRIDEAIALCRKVLPMAGGLSANIANNLGNVYFQRGNTEEAERYYTQAIGYDSVFSHAYLGRANTRIKAGNFQNAISDYEQYLTLEPLSYQKANIERLVSFVRAEITSEETRKVLAAEEERRVALERQAEDRRIAEERQRLLDSVSASLQSAADLSKGISSGSEKVEHYEGEFELE
jgi:tetratricopeptide (TPR) repeat protein